MSADRFHTLPVRLPTRTLNRVCAALAEVVGDDWLVFAAAEAHGVGGVGYGCSVGSAFADVEFGNDEELGQLP